MTEYGDPGRGGRQPVNWTGPAPQPRHGHRRGRRPVVAVLDTGVGEHPWLGDEHVTRDPRCSARSSAWASRAGRARRAASPTPWSASSRSDSGHGTFIAGLRAPGVPGRPAARRPPVRQHRGGHRVGAAAQPPAPRAAPGAARVARARDRTSSRSTSSRMSLGYYHEQPEDTAFDVLLARAARRCSGEYGVAVVVSAGNDASPRPIYPAAFAPYPGGPVARRPGAGAGDGRGRAQPRRHHRALQQRRCLGALLRPGAALVSTMPTTYDAVARAGQRGAATRAASCGPPSTPTTSAPGSACGAGRRSRRRSSPASWPRASSRTRTDAGARRPAVERHARRRCAGLLEAGSPRTGGRRPDAG